MKKRLQSPSEILTNPATDSANTTEGVRLPNMASHPLISAESFTTFATEVLRNVGVPDDRIGLK